LTTPDAKSTAIDDVRLANEVDRILRATGYMPLRDLEVIAHDGIVSLSGHVPSYYMK
jgi:osmotically-inducible protein OsmY